MKLVIKNKGFYKCYNENKKCYNIKNVVITKEESVITVGKKGSYIRFRIDEDLKKRLKEVCNKKGVTMSEMFCYHIEDIVKREEEKEKNVLSQEKRIRDTEEKLVKLREKFKEKSNKSYRRN